MSEAKATCEALTGDNCELASIEEPDWLHLTGELASPGYLAALVYIDADGELHDHEFDPRALPVLLVGPGGLVAIGSSVTLSDLGIED